MNAEEIVLLEAAIAEGVKELLALRDAAHAGAITAKDATDAAQLFTDRIAANRKAAQDKLVADFKTP